MHEQLNGKNGKNKIINSLKMNPPLATLFHNVVKVLLYDMIT